MVTIYETKDNRRKYLKLSAFIFFYVLFFIYFIIGRLMFGFNESVAIVMMIIGFLPIILIANETTGQKINTVILFVAGAIMITGKITYSFTLDPITTLDASRYYAQVIQFQGVFVQFLEFFWSSFKADYLMMSSYPAFGIVYLPFYILFKTESALLIVIFNTFSLLLIAFFSAKITGKYFFQESPNKKMFVSLIAAGILISPTLMYWSSTFSKDIFSVAIAVISLYFLLGKRYILFLLFLSYATMLRPYSIAIIAIYYMVYKGSKKLMLLGVIVSTAVVAYYIGVTGVANTVNTLAYVIAAPNPLNLENWSRFFLLEVEILITIIGLVLSLYVFINKKESRKFYLLALCGLFIYSCVMTMVGYGVIAGRDQVYALGSVGDDISRKKLPIIVLYYTVISYTFVNLRIKIRW